MGTADLAGDELEAVARHDIHVSTHPASFLSPGLSLCGKMTAKVDVDLEGHWVGVVPPWLSLTYRSTLNKIIIDTPWVHNSQGTDETVFMPKASLGHN